MTKIMTTGVDALNERLVLALARARAEGESGYQLAARARIHPSELSRWANGRRLPSLEQARRLAEALGCAVDDIFPVNESSPTVATAGSIKTTPDAGRSDDPE